MCTSTASKPARSKANAVSTCEFEPCSRSTATRGRVTRRLAALETQLTPLLASLQHSVDQSHALLANTNTLVRKAQAPVADAAKLEASIQALADSSRQLSQRLDRQTAPNFDQLSASLTRTSKQLDELLRELKAHPQSLIFGAPQHPPGPGEPGFQDNRKQEPQR